MHITKYNANGNDFVIYHSFVKKDRSQEAIDLCERQSGVGADGLIVLLPHPKLDFEWQFYNCDGSTAQMCGNGSRACAHYAYSNSLALSKMSFLTEAGVIDASVDGDMVQSDLSQTQIIDKEITHGGRSWWLIDTGVPHLVAFDKDCNTFDLKEAKELRDRYNANVNITTVQDNNSILVRTFERGVEAETLACGTGMAACFYRALQEKMVLEQCRAYPKSGETIYLSQHGNKTRLKGKVAKIFECNI